MERVEDSIEKNYIKYLRDKKVCLVGPAGHIESWDQKDLIESYDVVIRLNKSWPVPEFLQKCSGVRTDILYSAMASHCLPDDILTNMSKFKDNVKFLVCPFARDIPWSNASQRIINSDIPFIRFDSNRYESMMIKLKTNPNTGIAAIIHLLLYPIKELYITGIAFLQGDYVSGYRSHAPKLCSHTPSLQINYFREHCWGDPRISADEVFAAIMEKE